MSDGKCDGCGVDLAAANAAANKSGMTSTCTDCAMTQPYPPINCVLLGATRTQEPPTGARE